MKTMKTLTLSLALALCAVPSFADVTRKTDKSSSTLFNKAASGKPAGNPTTTGSATGGSGSGKTASSAVKPPAKPTPAAGKNNNRKGWGGTKQPQ